MRPRLSGLVMVVIGYLLSPLPVSAVESVSYLHQDHLGSTALVTDESGNVVGQEVYYPYGTTRNQLLANGYPLTTRKYTGQVSDTSQTGLYYYNARYYSPAIGKFTQADTVQGPNRYLYVNGNPINATDPTGRIPRNTSKGSLFWIHNKDTQNNNYSSQSTMVAANETNIDSNLPAFDPIFSINHDSLGGSSYQNFIGNSDSFIDAWTVKESIYSPWVITDTLAAIDNAPATLQPRWSILETSSIGQLDIPYIIDAYGLDTTAFILNSGGPHSLALAYKLANEGGWQPVPMLKGIPCPKNTCTTHFADEHIATAMYPATEMLSITQRLSPDSPPAFIWDAHRNSIAFGDVKDTSYSFDVTNLPNAQFLIDQGITNIIYINEGTNRTLQPWLDYGYDIDSFNILRSYKENGLNIFTLGIPPN